MGMKEAKRPHAAVNSPLNAHRRLLLALVAAAAVAFLLPSILPPAARLAIAWDSAAVVFLMTTGWVVQACPPEKMQQTVLANDQGRVGILVLVLLAVASSVAAIFFLIQKSAAGAERPLAQVALAVFTIVCSWILTHVMFALHYAHRFYRDDPATPESDATGGLKFPGEARPHYWDFLYFSFVIGMTAQVSDVQVTSRPMRRLVLWHGILSFAFYTIILALSINIVASVL
jgi:uncharacterized membrane protein